MLKSCLKAKDCSQFKFHYLSNETVKSYNNQSPKMDKEIKNLFSRWTKSIIELSVVFSEFPKKPNDVMTLDDWKTNLSNIIQNRWVISPLIHNKHNLKKTSKKKQ